MELMNQDDLIYVLHASAEGTHLQETKRVAIELLQGEMVTLHMRESMLRLRDDFISGGANMCMEIEPVLFFRKKDLKYCCSLTELVHTSPEPGGVVRVRRDFVFTWQPMHGEERAYLEWEEEGGSIDNPGCT